MTDAPVPVPAPRLVAPATDSLRAGLRSSAEAVRSPFRPSPPAGRPHALAASGAEMLLYVFFIAGCSAVLFIATSLRPDPHGLGTHQEMGFPPCSMIQWFDTPCAFCGMTTCFTLCAGGHWLTAFATQPFGVVLYLLTVVLFVSSAYGLTRRFSWMEWISERAIIRTTTGLLIMMLAGWIYKIIIYKSHIEF